MDTGEESRHRAQQASLLRLVDSLPIPVVAIDKEFRVLIWNAAAVDEFGWTAGEVVGRTNPTIPPEIQPSWQDVVREVFAGRQLRNARTSRVRRDGTRVEVLVSTAILRNPSEDADGAVAVYFVREDLEAKEQRVRRAEQRARALLDSTGDLPVLIFDEDGAALHFNPAAAKLFARNASLPDIYADRDHALADAERALRTGHATREGWVVDQTGSLRWADIFVSAVRIDHARELIVFIREAEARRQRERVREEISNFASQALAARTIDDLAAAAVRCIAASTTAARVEMLSAGAGDHELQILHATTPYAQTVPVTRDTMFAAALAGDAPVQRKLTDLDMRNMPHLAMERLTSGAATAVTLNGKRGVLAAYWREHDAAAEEEIFRLSACATIVAVAAARLSTEHQLVDRERQLRLMLDQLPAVVWTTDRNLDITDMRGVIPGRTETPGQFIGRNVADLAEPHVVDAIRGVLAGTPLARYTLHSGEELFDVRVDPLRDQDGAVTGTVAVAFDVTEHQRAKDALRQMAASINAMQENERQRIARELHDGMGQQLTALRLELGLLRREAGEWKFAERISEMEALVDSTADAMRRAITDLRPAILDDFGFRAAVETELTALHRRSGMAYELRLPPEDPPLDRDTATALFRIVQEALTNVARHAAATRVCVVVSIEDNDVLLEVSDNGRGITQAQARPSSASLGLVGVRERAWAVGGSVCIEGSTESGTRLVVRVPSSSPKST